MFPKQQQHCFSDIFESVRHLSFSTIGPYGVHPKTISWQPAISLKLASFLAFGCHFWS